MELLGGNAHFTAQAELPAVGKAGGGVPVHGGGVHLPLEGMGSLLVAGDDALGVAGGVGGDVSHSPLHTVHHPDRQDIVQELGVKVPLPGGRTVNDGGGRLIQPQLHRRLSYRNSKNFGANWISAGYGLWFLREARFLNFPRMLLGTNCAISGTGFLVSGEVIRENGGWPFHLLTEDIEFSVNCAIEGKVIGYCDKAVIYDEQPLKFGQSWTQRLRWSKGFYQVDWHYSWRLIKGFFQGGRKSFSCYDIFMTVAPGMFFTLAAILINLGMAFSYMTEPGYIARMIAAENISFLTRTIVMFYLSLLVYGAITMISEWKQVQLSALKKILYTFTFPIFMFTYIPISAVALVKKVEWKPICHGNTSGELITSKRN